MGEFEDPGIEIAPEHDMNHKDDWKNYYWVYIRTFLAIVVFVILIMWGYKKCVK